MKTLKRGDIGPSVNEVQQAINRRGFGPLTVDGDFGAGTERAVEQFQMAHDLEADGIVGPKTWAELLVEGRRNPSPKVMVEAQQELLEIVAGLPIDQRRADVLRSAIADLGKKESPKGDNEGPEINHLVAGYRAYWKYEAEKAPAWCAMACSSWIRIGLKLAQGNWKPTPMRHFFGGATQWMKWGQAQGTWSQSPQPGDVFVMLREASGSDTGGSAGAGHAGMVIEVLEGGTKVRTIEGNVSDSVVSMVRKVSDLKGFVSWWKQ